MAEEPKIFTKSQLLEKLTEVAKKQKEKNDVVINQKDNEINDLTTKLNQAIESLNAFKTAQEDILNNVNELTNTNKALNEQIAKLEQQLKENNSTDKYVEFYSMVAKLVSEIDSNDSVNVENTAEDKPAKKQKNSKKKQEVITETDDDDVNAVAVVNVVDTTAENIEVNNCDDDSIDVDALLSDL